MAITVTCQAQLGWWLVAVNGFPQSVADICGQVVGLRRYTGEDAASHTYCSQPGHEEQVRRRYPERHQSAALCGCWAILHSPVGCPNEAEPHPEGDDPMPCRNCQPFDSIGVHADDIRPGDAAYALQAYGNWAPGELAEAWGK